MDNSSAAAAGALTIGLVVGLVAFIVMMVPYWRIVSKAGYNGWLSLLMLVPLVNIVMLFVFAFSEWPIEHRAHGEQMHSSP